MSETHNDFKVIKDKYELLQSLCKQQIMLNETLKSELTKLGNLYKKVSLERNALLSELVENRLSCSTVLDNDNSLPTSSGLPSCYQDVHKRTVHRQSLSPNPTKKPKTHLEDSRLSGFSNNNLVVSSDDMVCNDRDSDNFAPPRTSERAPSYPSGVMARTNMSRLQHMATQHNSPTTISSSFGLSSQALNSSAEGSRDGSPPSITVANNNAVNQLQQRSSKSASLLSNSSVGGTVPFVPFATSKIGATAVNLAKSTSLTGGKISAAGPASRPSVPVNFVRNSSSTNQPSLLRSPQGTSNLRLPYTTGGPRILIQPSSANVRPVLIQTSESTGGLSEEHQ